MRFGLIGVGGAGVNAVDTFVGRTGTDTAVEFALAVDATEADLESLENVSRDQRILVGKQRVKGHGAGADAELGSELIEDDLDEIQRRLDDHPVGALDAFLIVAGLAGGTGGGGAAVLAAHLGRIYSEPALYGLGILPEADEGNIYTTNASRSLRAFVERTDTVILFDNESWREGSVEYEEVNTDLVGQIAPLFRALAGTPAHPELGSEEIANAIGDGGIVTLSTARETVPTDSGPLASKLFGEGDGSSDAEDRNRITALVREAAIGQHTLSGGFEAGPETVLVVSGPAEHLDRRGILRARDWLDSQREGTVRAGGYTVAEPCVTATVLVTDVSSRRVKALIGGDRESRRDLPAADDDSLGRVPIVGIGAEDIGTNEFSEGEAETGSEAESQPGPPSRTETTDGAETTDTPDGDETTDIAALPSLEEGYTEPRLRDAGYETVADLRAATDEELLEISGIVSGIVARIRADLEERE